LGSCHLISPIDGDLEDAYRLTQNIEDAWTESGDPRVNPALTDEQRSTSVGDVMEVDGVFYVVSSFGFDVLENYAIPVKS